MTKLGHRSGQAIVVALAVVGAFTATAARSAASEVAPTTWTSLGGAITSDPAVVALDETRVVHFARGNDGALWRYSQGVEDGLPAGWASLGGSIIGAPAAVRTSAGVELFAHGLDHGLWHRVLSGGVWSQWQGLGGVLTSDPAAWNRGSDPVAEEVRVFVRGNDGSVWQQRRGGDVWEGWTSLGGTAVGAPAAAQGRVVVRGTDNRVWSSVPSGSGFSRWTPIPGGSVSSDPAVAGGGELWLWARGLDGALWNLTFNGFAGPAPGMSGPDNTYQWRSLGGQLIGGPGASCVPLEQSPANQIAVVDIRGADSALWTINGGTSPYWMPECP